MTMSPANRYYKAKSQYQKIISRYGLARIEADKFLSEQLQRLVNELEAAGDGWE